MGKPMLSPSELERLLVERLGAAHVLINDLTGTQDHYQVRIVAEAFAGRSAIERHRMVYAALAEELKGPIHALSLQTLAPNEE